MNDDYKILCYIRDELLSNPYIDSGFVWDAFRLAERNSDMHELFVRWMSASFEEKIMIENVMEDLLKVYSD